MGMFGNWGRSPWVCGSYSSPSPLGDHYDFAIVGGGLTGLATALWVKKSAPQARIAVLEAEAFGSGASARNGGIVLNATLAGNPATDIGDTLASLAESLETFRIACEFRPSEVHVLSRGGAEPGSVPLAWRDNGTLNLVRRLSGGVLNPALLLDGLIREALRSGIELHDRSPVARVEDGLRLADQVVIAVNGSGPHLNPWPTLARTQFTLAAITAPLTDPQWRAMSVTPDDRPRPFFTADLPALWGRPLDDRRFIFGEGELDGLPGEEVYASRIEALCLRVRALHPELSDLAFTDAWSGPILMTHDERPIMRRHPDHPRALALGGCCGQGLALAFHLAKAGAKALLERSR